MKQAGLRAKEPSTTCAVRFVVGKGKPTARKARRGCPSRYGRDSDFDLSVGGIRSLEVRI